MPRLSHDGVFRAGLVLAVLALAQLVVAWAVEPAWGWGLGATMAAELVTGREAAIPLALGQGVPPWWIALASILQNLALAGIVVQAAMAAAARAETGKGRLASFLRHLHATARDNRHRASSAWGIFVFMLVPFLANGPILAGLIGRLIGVDSRRLAFAVIAAVAITATAWAYLYATLTAALASVSPSLARVPPLLAAAITLAAVARIWWVWRARETQAGRRPGAGPP